MFLLNAILDQFLGVTYCDFCFPGDFPLKPLGLLTLVTDKSADGLLNRSEEIHRHPLCLISIHFLSPGCTTVGTTAGCMFLAKPNLTCCKKPGIATNSLAFFLSIALRSLTGAKYAPAEMRASCRY
jgi:hypothetical protein